MTPTLLSKDTILVSKLFRIHIRDIVILKNPEKKQGVPYIVKRIAMIKKKMVYVTGDNKKESYDSRNFGWVEQKQIIGKMIKRLPT
jgi:type IV secretory pathway protease TraF